MIRIYAGIIRKESAALLHEIAIYCAGFFYFGVIRRFSFLMKGELS